jgi:hypothetical protein
MAESVEILYQKTVELVWLDGPLFSLSLHLDPSLLDVALTFMMGLPSQLLSHMSIFSGNTLTDKKKIV